MDHKNIIIYPFNLWIAMVFDR